MKTLLTSDALRGADPAAIAALETPCFVFDPATVIEDHAQLRAELGTPLVVSMKANPVLDLLVRCNHAFTDGIEIASLGELNLTVGRMTVPRFVNTPALDATLIGAALACRATVIADSEAQVEMVLEAARKAKSPVRMGLRLNAAALLGPAPRHADHFGMDLPALWRVLDRLAGSPLRVAGLHVFAGSHSFSASAEAIAERMTALVADLRGHAAVALEFVNLGGGFPANWRESAIDFAAYRARLVRLQQQVSVLHEAGRAVFSRGGAFLTRVTGLKALEGRTIAVCDGGMAQCFALAQTESFVKRPRVPRLLRSSTGTSMPAAEQAILVAGNSCNRADLLGRLEGPLPAPGDMLVFDHCGAYHTYSPNAFLNLRPAQRYIAS